VDAEVLLLPEVAGQGLVEGPDGEGQAAAVFHDGGDVAGDPVIGLRDGPAGQVDRGLLGLHEKVEIVDVHEGVPDRPGDAGVDLRHDERRLFHGVAGHVDPQPETGVSLLVRRRDLDDGRVDVDGARLEEPGDPREAARDEVHPARRDGVAGHPSGVEGLEAVLLRVALVDGDRVAEAHELDQLEILQIPAVRGHELPDECARLGHPRSEEDGHAGPDPLQHLLGLDDPVFPEGRVLGAVEHGGVTSTKGSGRRAYGVRQTAGHRSVATVNAPSSRKAGASKPSFDHYVALHPCCQSGKSLPSSVLAPRSSILYFSPSKTASAARCTSGLPCRSPRRFRHGACASSRRRRPASSGRSSRRPSSRR